MSNARRDGNFIPARTAVSKDDGTTIILLTANPVTHCLVVEDGATGTDYGPEDALRDDNNVPTMLAVSSADGETVVPLYANGGLLIQST